MHLGVVQLLNTRQIQVGHLFRHGGNASRTYLEFRERHPQVEGVTFDPCCFGTPIAKPTTIAGHHDALLDLNVHRCHYVGGHPALIGVDPKTVTHFVHRGLKLTLPP